MELIESNATIDIPPQVAVCPYCGKKLTAAFTGWEQTVDGSWIANTVELDCEGEPDIESDTEAFDEWLGEHTYMPYVYWLPVTELVTKWINSKYRFKIV